MNGRRDRILIPSAVALISMGSTLWLANLRTKDMTDLLSLNVPSLNPTLDFLVGAGIVTIGIGYLCNALFTLRMLCSEKCRFIDFSKLVSAFGLSEPKYEKQSWCQQRKEWKQLKEELLDEFHLRLHSHAPQSLIDYCSRHNSAWYIAKTSALASILGCFVAIGIIFTSSRCVDIASSKGAVSIAVFVVVIPLALSWQGTVWNREFWGVCWKWIAWDQQTHPLPKSWFKMQQEARVEHNSR
jgi:hypothetical protein